MTRLLHIPEEGGALSALTTRPVFDDDSLHRTAAGPLDF
jgi:hypothetical protein